VAQVVECLPSKHEALSSSPCVCVCVCVFFFLLNKKIRKIFKVETLQLKLKLNFLNTYKAELSSQYHQQETEATKFKGGSRYGSLILQT
jgi:hypothetical protein